MKNRDITRHFVSCKSNDVNPDDNLVFLRVLQNQSGASIHQDHGYWDLSLDLGTV
jgi:hypothetical protein